MRRSLPALLATLAVLAAPSALHPQSRPSSSASLGGVRYTVPAEYAVVAALSDSTTTVYANAADRTWAFVALLPAATERQAVVRNLLRRLGAHALGGKPDTLEWQLVPDGPLDASEAFHQRVVSLGGAASLDLSVRQVRAGSRDVLVGAGFMIDFVRSPLALCGAVGSFPAGYAEEWLAASVRGLPTPDVLSFSRRNVPGIQVAPPGGAAPPPPPPDPEAARVLAAYAAYVRALQARDTAAATLLTPAVLALFADLRTLALRGTPQEVRALPLMHRMEVLELRHQFDAARLRAMTLRELFAGLSSGMAIDPAIVPDTPVVEGGVATVGLREGARRTSLRVSFVRGRGRWLVDILPLLAGSECLLRATLRARGVTREQENALLLQALQRRTGRAPSPDIWEPLERTD